TTSLSRYRLYRLDVFSPSALRQFPGDLAKRIDKSFVQSCRLPVAPCYQPYRAPCIRHGLVQNGKAVQLVVVVEIATHDKCQELAAQHQAAREFEQFAFRGHNGRCHSLLLEHGAEADGDAGARRIADPAVAGQFARADLAAPGQWMVAAADDPHLALAELL